MAKNIFILRKIFYSWTSAIYSLVDILVFFFLSWLFCFHSFQCEATRQTQSLKPKYPGSLAFTPVHFRLVCHPNILLTMATEFKEKGIKLKIFYIDQLALVYVMQEDCEYFKYLLLSQHSDEVSQGN